MIDKSTIESMINRASNTELEIFWIPKIVANQTHDEERSEETIENNRIGLNGRDAKFVTSVYHQITSGGHLTVRQSESIKKVLPKCWRQYNTR